MLKVSVKDFGPIIEGTVDLKPLTLFVGPSNAGKSYLAMLVYSLMKSSDAYSIDSFGGPISYDYFRFGRLVGRRSAMPLVDGDAGVVKAINRWAQSIEINPQEALEIPFVDLPEGVQHLVHNTVEKSFKSMGQLFSEDLQRCHGDISDIRSRRRGAARLQIGLEQSQPRLILNFEEDQEALRVLPGAEWDMSKSKFPIRRGLARSLQAGAASRRSRRSGNILEAHYEFLVLLMEIASATLFEKFPRGCYYLPAARSGIAQGHKAIASILVRQSSFAAIRPLEIPTLSGIITDFMGHILTMERAGSRHLGRDVEVEAVEDVVDFLETQVLRGKIDIERDREMTYPEISYAPVSGQPDTGKFPFHKTSSMVSELAPVILFLKYLVRPGDLIILEEPESHLHPASQRQMARGIARLVNAGVRVIITTHSDYFIGQINNLLKLSRASGQKRTREDYDAVDCLKSDDVSAYHFRLDDRSGGSRVEELPILPDFGIDEQEFAAVSEALYEETVSLQRTRANR